MLSKRESILSSSAPGGAGEREILKVSIHRLNRPPRCKGKKKEKKKEEKREGKKEGLSPQLGALVWKFVSCATIGQARSVH